MNNGDMPGYPYPEDEEIGLTKREIFAKDAMLGLLASPGGADQGTVQVARAAVHFAEALLEELEK